MVQPMYTHGARLGKRPEPRMNTDGHGLLLEVYTHRIVGCAMEVLKITGLRVGLLLNFRRPRLEWKRIVQ